MHLNRRIVIQLVIFSIVSLVAATVMVFGYIKFPTMLGIGRYSVTVELPRSGGLYESGNVTYRGTKVGKVASVELVPTGGVRAVLSLDSSYEIPSDLVAEVHSQSAVGEQYVALVPRDSVSAPLKNGDLIASADTTLPPPIDELLDSANRGLDAIPHDNLKTAIDESYLAVGGLGPELSRIIQGSTTLAIDARADIESLTAMIDRSAPVLDSQAESGDAIRDWAANLAVVTDQLRDNDAALAGMIDGGGPAAERARELVELVKPTLPVILANLVSVGGVAVTYAPDLEQLLVLLPQGIANVQGGLMGNLNSKQDYRGGYLDFNLNINLPAPCTTGFLPPQQRRTAAQVDAPDRPVGDLYCRIPQDAQQNVRGARNLPCRTKPGKRAPTVAMCESDEQYVPLNNGQNWKGDPNATMSGQAIPQLPPGTSPAVPAAPPVVIPPAGPALAIVAYDPATGTYVGPDGKVYTQADLAQNGQKDMTWQSMLVPPS